MGNRWGDRCPKSSVTVTGVDCNSYGASVAVTEICNDVIPDESTLLQRYSNPFIPFYFLQER